MSVFNTLFQMCWKALGRFGKRLRPRRSCYQCLSYLAQVWQIPSRAGQSPASSKSLWLCPGMTHDTWIPLPQPQPYTPLWLTILSSTSHCPGLLPIDRQTHHPDLQFSGERLLIGSSWAKRFLSFCKDWELTLTPLQMGLSGAPAQR